MARICFRAFAGIIALGLVVLSTSPTIGFDKPAILGGKSDVKDIVSHFRAEMAALIAQAGGEARVTLTRAFQLTDSLINSLSAAYGDAVKITFDELDGQQQKAFLDTAKLIDQMKAAVQEPGEKSIQLGNDATQVLADVLSWSKKPLVTNYFPGYIAPSSISDSIRISVIGSRLHAGRVEQPVLEIGSTKFKPDEVTDRSISFVVARTSFPTPRKGTVFQRATLTMFREAERSWWAWWWPFRSFDELKFPLLFTVVPDALGTYEVKRTIRVDSLDRKPYVPAQNAEATKNGGGGYTDTQCYAPAQGYKFDVSTAAVRKTKHTAYKDNDTSPGTNEAQVGFYQDRKSPTEICIFATASTGCKECGGTTHAALEVTQMRTVTTEVPADDPPKPLAWNKEVAVTLRENAVRQTLIIRLFDEMDRLSSATSPRNLDFLKIEPDLRESVVLLRPQTNWQAK